MAFVPHFDDLPLEDAILDSPTFRNDAKKKEEETLHFLEDLCKLSKAMADTNIYLQSIITFSFFNELLFFSFFQVYLLFDY